MVRPHPAGFCVGWRRWAVLRANAACQADGERVGCARRHGALVAQGPSADAAGRTVTSPLPAREIAGPAPLWSVLERHRQCLHVALRRGMAAGLARVGAWVVSPAVPGHRALRGWRD